MCSAGVILGCLFNSGNLLVKIPLNRENEESLQKIHAVAWAICSMNVLSLTIYVCWSHNPISLESGHIEISKGKQLLVELADVLSSFLMVTFTCLVSHISMAASQQMLDVVKTLPCKPDQFEEQIHKKCANVLHTCPHQLFNMRMASGSCDFWFNGISCWDLYLREQPPEFGGIKNVFQQLAASFPINFLVLPPLYGPWAESICCHSPARHLRSISMTHENLMHPRISKCKPWRPCWPMWTMDMVGASQYSRAWFCPKSLRRRCVFAFCWLALPSSPFWMHSWGTMRKKRKPWLSKSTI